MPLRRRRSTRSLAPPAPPSTVPPPGLCAGLFAARTDGRAPGHRHHRAAAAGPGAAGPGHRGGQGEASASGGGGLQAVLALPLPSPLRIRAHTLQGLLRLREKRRLKRAASTGASLAGGAANEVQLEWRDLTCTLTDKKTGWVGAWAPPLLRQEQACLLLLLLGPGDVQRRAAAAAAAAAPVQCQGPSARARQGKPSAAPAVDRRSPPLCRPRSKKRLLLNGVSGTAAPGRLVVRGGGRAGRAQAACRAGRLVCARRPTDEWPPRAALLLLQAIMGPSGSGKTTLLSALAAQMAYSPGIHLQARRRRRGQAGWGGRACCCCCSGLAAGAPPPPLLPTTWPGRPLRAPAVPGPCPLTSAPARLARLATCPACRRAASPSMAPP